MKKIILVSLFFIAIVTSCKKEYTCTCTDFYGNNAYEKTGKGRDASDACADATDKVLGVPLELCSPKE